MRATVLVTEDNRLGDTTLRSRKKLGEKAEDKRTPPMEIVRKTPLWRIEPNANVQKEEFVTTNSGISDMRG